MLALAEFIAKLAGMLGTAILNVSRIQRERRKRHADYLDKVSETLAKAANACRQDGDLLQPLTELRYHLEHIGEVLRLGDPAYLMAMSDDTVSRMRDELGRAIDATPFEQLKLSGRIISSGDDILTKRIDLEKSLLAASGLFRAAAITLHAKD